MKSCIVHMLAIKHIVGTSCADREPSNKPDGAVAFT